MRIGCLQFAPQLGDVDNNLNRADAVLSRVNPKDLSKLDLLVLPELCFSGYNFRSLEHITPYLEPTTSGITSLWARTTALKYNCVVTAGYPEKVDVRAKWPAGPEYYNSAITVNAEGETVANYRKTFLYSTDETWALEGKGFYSGKIDGLGNVAMGICMDLNPYKFEAPWNSWEFSYHVLFKQANLVVMSMAWLTREDITTFSRSPHEPDMETLSYWLSRLEPLIRAETVGEIIVVIANRCGSEDDAVYAGTSTVLGIESGEVKVYGILGRGDKELLVVDTNRRPKAKLVSEPPSAASTATDTTTQSRETDASGSTTYTSPDEDMVEDMDDYNDGYSSLSAKETKTPGGHSGTTSSDDESFYRESLPSAKSYSSQPSPRFPLAPASPNSAMSVPPSPQTRGRSRTRAQPPPSKKSPWAHHQTSWKKTKPPSNAVAHVSPQNPPPTPISRGRTRERTQDPAEAKPEPTSILENGHSSSNRNSPPPKKRGRTRDRTRSRVAAETAALRKDLPSPSINFPMSPEKKDSIEERRQKAKVISERQPEPEVMAKPEPEPELLSPMTYSPAFTFPKQSPTQRSPPSSSPKESSKIIPKPTPIPSPTVEAPPIPPRGRAREKVESSLTVTTPRDSTSNTQGKSSNASGSTAKSSIPSGSTETDRYQSYFTTKTFGERSEHINGRPRSAYW